MIKDILEAIRCRDEEVLFLGKAYTVRELSASASLYAEDAAERAGKADDKIDAYWRLFVRCVFDKETGAQVFQDDDIAELRVGSRIKLAPLCAAVGRCNGLDEDDNAKNSTAVQA